MQEINLWIKDIQKKFGKNLNQQTISKNLQYLKYANKNRKYTIYDNSVLKMKGKEAKKYEHKFIKEIIEFNKFLNQFQVSVIQQLNNAVKIDKKPLVQNLYINS